MNRAPVITILVSVLGLAALHSCATPQAPRERPPVPPRKPAPAETAPVEKKPVMGIKGSIVLVDERGEEIPRQNRAQAVLSITPTKDGKPVEGKTSSISPEEDGSFFVSLKEGVYSVEVFVKGFHIESFTVSVRRNEVAEMGKVTVKKFETEGGRPAKGEPKDVLPPNEGDVNIQPPVS